MAITLASARVFNKLLCLSEALHPVSSCPVLVCIIGCSIEQTTSQPNAIIIPVPGKLSPTNVIDTKYISGIWADILASSAPPERKRFDDSIVNRITASTFDEQLFTLAVADDASRIRQTLQTLPETSRPHIKNKLLDWLIKNYSGYSFVIAAFSDAGIKHAAPILFWYEPTSDIHLMLPGVTTSDGNPPDPSLRISDYHCIVLGSQTRHMEKMSEVTYNVASLRAYIQSPESPYNTYRLPLLVNECFLPKYVHAARFSGEQLNGDFVGPRQFVLHRGPTLLRREILQLP